MSTTYSFSRDPPAARTCQRREALLDTGVRDSLLRAGTATASSSSASSGCAPSAASRLMPAFARDDSFSSAASLRPAFPAGGQGCVSVSIARAQATRVPVGSHLVVLRTLIRAIRHASIVAESKFFLHDGLALLQMIPSMPSQCFRAPSRRASKRPARAVDFARVWCKIASMPPQMDSAAFAFWEGQASSSSFGIVQRRRVHR